MKELISQLPPQLKPRVGEITGVTDAFCRDHLNDEYCILCQKVVAAAAEVGLPLTSGKAAGWAGGVVAAVGFANFLGDPSQPFHMTTEEMARKIGISPATLHNKSKAIRDALDIVRFDPRFATRPMTDQNPFTWILMVDGMPMDIRTAPRGAQEEALRRGLIPYIPGNGAPSDANDRTTAARKRKSSERATAKAAKAAVP